VSPPELLPFDDEHLDAAAAVLAEAHARHRAAEPLLADGDAGSAVELAWRHEGTSGAVAIQGGEVTAYLFGREAENAMWGRHVFVDRAGQAADDAELVRDLFALAAERWSGAGIQRYFANVPSLPERLDPWYRLGFAQMHQDAIRETSGGPVAPADVVVRSGGRVDLELAIRVGRQIAEVQTLAPSFSELPPADERDDWIETLEAEDVTYFVAERDGDPVGHATLYPPAPDLGTPADAVYLASTATLPEARGSGAGLALTAHALEWAEAAGHATMVTSWRVTNLLASRFWPARGFRPTYVRLHRSLVLRSPSRRAR
jgi:GNAT superfamily N-acetyltransferase